MKNRSFYIAISILTLGLGIAAVYFYYQCDTQNVQTENNVTKVIELTVPRFRYISGSPTCSPFYYSFQSSTEPKVFSDDCIGCGEVGNISIYKESHSAEQTQYLFKANSEKEVVEKSIVIDKSGGGIGERALSLFKDKDKDKIVNARIYWTENDDFWIIDAPTLELVKEFEESDAFKTVKAEVDSSCVSK